MWQEKENPSFDVNHCSSTAVATDVNICLLDSSYRANQGASGAAVSA